MKSSNIPTSSYTKKNGKKTENSFNFIFPCPSQKTLYLMRKKVLSEMNEPSQSISRFDVDIVNQPQTQLNTYAQPQHD
jgi:hypothetical protein